MIEIERKKEQVRVGAADEEERKRMLTFSKDHA